MALETGVRTGKETNVAVEAVRRVGKFSLSVLREAVNVINKMTPKSELFGRDRGGHIPMR